VITTSPIEGEKRNNNNDVKISGLKDTHPRKIKSYIRTITTREEFKCNGQLSLLET